MRGIRKNRNENESEMEKKERLAKLAGQKGRKREFQYDNESELEKKERLAKIAEQNGLKRGYQKSGSVIEDNRSDANYDAEKYTVRLHYDFDDYDDDYNIILVCICKGEEGTVSYAF